MEGIQYVTDGAGNKKAIQIDLEKYGALVEDLLESINLNSEASKKAEKTSEIRLSDKYFKSISDETAKRLHEHVEKGRSEWER